MLKIIVCDDQVIELNKINELLAEFNASFLSIHISLFTSSLKLSQDIEAIQSTDVFLLDIVMPHLSGIDLGKLIRIHNKDASIIFLTTSTDFALDAYSVEALQYLIKPVQKDNLFQAIKKSAVLASKKESYFQIQTRSEVIPVKTNDIKYIEYKDHVLYFCVNDDIIKSKFYRLSFTSLIPELFNHKDFIMTHRAYLVNMKHVNKIHPQTFEMDNLQQIPISSNKKTQVRNAYMNFLIER